MTHQARSALVLQGGGALGAYELGAARALYEDGRFNPDMIAGVVKKKLGLSVTSEKISSSRACDAFASSKFRRRMRQKLHHRLHRPTRPV